MPTNNESYAWIASKIPSTPTPLAASAADQIVRDLRDGCLDIERKRAADLIESLIAQLARAEAEKAELLCDLREVNANNAAQFERAEEAEERVKLLAAAMQIHGVPLP